MFISFGCCEHCPPFQPHYQNSGTVYFSEPASAPDSSGSQSDDTEFVNSEGFPTDLSLSAVSDVGRDIDEAIRTESLTGANPPRFEDTSSYRFLDQANAQDRDVVRDVAKVSARGTGFVDVGAPTMTLGGQEYGLTDKEEANSIGGLFNPRVFQPMPVPSAAWTHWKPGPLNDVFQQNPVNSVGAPLNEKPYAGWLQNVTDFVKDVEQKYPGPAWTDSHQQAIEKQAHTIDQHITKYDKFLNKTVNNLTEHAQKVQKYFQDVKTNASEFANETIKNWTMAQNVTAQARQDRLDQELELQKQMQEADKQLSAKGDLSQVLQPSLVQQVPDQPPWNFGWDTSHSEASQNAPIGESYNYMIPAAISKRLQSPDGKEILNDMITVEGSQATPTKRLTYVVDQGIREQLLKMKQIQRVNQINAKRIEAIQDSVARTNVSNMDANVYNATYEDELKIYEKKMNASVDGVSNYTNLTLVPPMPPPVVPFFPSRPIKSEFNLTSKLAIKDLDFSSTHPEGSFAAPPTEATPSSPSLMETEAAASESEPKALQFWKRRINSYNADVLKLIHPPEKRRAPSVNKKSSNSLIFKDVRSFLPKMLRIHSEHPAPRAREPRTESGDLNSIVSGVVTTNKGKFVLTRNAVGQIELLPIQPTEPQSAEREFRPQSDRAERWEDVVVSFRDSVVPDAKRGNTDQEARMPTQTLGGQPVPEPLPQADMRAAMGNATQAKALSFKVSQALAAQAQKNQNTVDGLLKGGIQQMAAESEAIEPQMGTTKAILDAAVLGAAGNVIGGKDEVIDGALRNSSRLLNGARQAMVKVHIPHFNLSSPDIGETMAGPDGSGSASGSSAGHEGGSE